MNYLIIGDTTDRINYVVFRNTKLFGFLYKNFSSTNPLEQAIEIEKEVIRLVKLYEIDIVVVKWYDYYKLKPKKAFDLIAFRSIIRLGCAKTKTVYLEVDSYGWEKYFKEINKKNKFEYIKNAYDLDLKSEKDFIIKNKEPIADCIILGEAVSNQRITAKPRQPIQYKWGGKND